MSVDTTPAVPGEGAQYAPVSDEQSAANAIAGLLDLGEDDAGVDAGEEDSGQEPDAGADESQPTGDQEDGQDETPATPASIAPPTSWSAEDKAVFASLPPSAQAIVARRESERDAHLTRQGQEIANERKGWDSERQAISAERNQYVASLNQLAAFVVPEAKFYEGIDWAKLAADDPARYVQLSAQRDQLRGRVAAIQQEYQRVTVQQQADQKVADTRLLAEQQKLLHERVPELRDTAKASKFSADLSQMLTSQYGFTPDEIGGVRDNRLLWLAADLARYRTAEAARASAVTKRANVPPTVQKAGAAQAPDSQGRRIQQKIAALGRTNGVREAASLLEEMIS